MDTSTAPPPRSARTRPQPALPRFVIVGGGLAGGLIALALGRTRRGGAVTLLEREGALGGNHTWSFHDTDLDAEGHRLVEGLVTHRWPRHEVRFPGYTRTVASGYASIDSGTFARHVRAELEARGVEVRLGAAVAEVGVDEVRLSDGALLRGDVVIDARGPARGPSGARAGFQKFVGLEVELSADGPWAAPILMDATVPQLGGYRFVYVLPFSERRVLIEDTVYGDEPRLDLEDGERAVLHYGLRAGARVARVLRRESGVLPLPITGRPPGDGALPGPLGVGYRGGFLHPVTGYALPLAVRLALALAAARSAAEARAAVAALARGLRAQQRFGRLLNRLMFDGLPSAARRGAFERFYRLPAPTIARFYASRSTFTDRARVLIGRPPAGIAWGRLLGGRAHRPQGDRP